MMRNIFKKFQIKWFWMLVMYTLVFATVNTAFGQSDLDQLLQIAQENSPSIAEKQALAEASKEEVSLEKKTLLPSVDIGYDANFATYNNITGMNYPGNNVPISGPPSDDNYGGTVGSGVSMMVKWSPITFGERKNAIAHNQSIYEKQLASVSNEVLRIQFQVAFYYLEIASTKELITTYEKNIERNEFNLTRITKLVESGIRPSVDSLKVNAELSKSKSQLYQLKNLLVSQEEQLKEYLSSDGVKEITTSTFFFDHLPSVIKTYTGTATFVHPTLTIVTKELEANETRLTEIKRAWTPKLEFWGTTYARGSGVAYDGTVNHADGWGMQRYNYGVGLQLVFPIMDLASQKTKNIQQKAVVRASQENIRKVENNLKKQEVTARTGLNTALAIAKEVPVEYEASQGAYLSMQTRYEQGLVNYTELIEAQYNLLDAETKLKNAYASAWKSLLQLAVVKGDIQLFLNQIKN
ncbi:TolC family protein [Flammeovirga sp. SubArs3]|uniref:TolC family protein n=1 Tax=Flammeovirga sp. SubArs3 TaxID=2995316 RepID=UPI00248C14EB|nr:TolC family protein [Flammeovirga sp. SubArs3]